MASRIVTEEWRPIPKWDGIYEVSNLGRVRSKDRLLRHWRGGKRIHRGITLVNVDMGNGYFRVTLRDATTRRVEVTFVHRLVLRAFRGPPPSDKHICNHIDGDPSNNTTGNLEWCTHAENMRHAADVLGVAVGERNPSARLTEDDVSEIRVSLKRGDETGTAIAARYGVCPSTVTWIKNGGTWRHM